MENWSPESEAGLPPAGCYPRAPWPLWATVFPPGTGDDCTRQQCQAHRRGKGRALSSRLCLSSHTSHLLQDSLGVLGSGGTP